MEDIEKFPTFAPLSGVKMASWRAFGYVVIRPIRRVMWWAARGSFGLRLIPKRQGWLPWWHLDEWRFPNPHFWFLYRTIGKLATWMKWDAWRPFCDWTGGWRRTFPWYARLIHRVGNSLSYAFHGGECYHCASEDGDPVWLADDDTGKTFRLIETWTSATEDGTDHRFRGITTCPRCGYQREYEDGSL